MEVWLLLLVAALVMVVQALYLRLRRLESVRTAQETLRQEETAQLEATVSHLVEHYQPSAAASPTSGTYSPYPRAQVEAPATAEADWPQKARVMARCGATAETIAQTLGVPRGEVDLVLGLARAQERGGPPSDHTAHHPHDHTAESK